MGLKTRWSRVVIGYRLILKASASLLLAVSTIAMVPSHASAATKTKTSGSLVFTGGLKGTLKLGSKSTCDTSASGVTLGSFTTSLKSKSFSGWSVTVKMPKLDTYKKFRPGIDTFTLEASGSSSWVAISGSMTLIAHSGSVNLTLGREGGFSGTVYVAGTWICAS